MATGNSIDQKHLFDWAATSRRCSKCQAVKPVAEFNKKTRRGKLGLSYWCKACNRAHSEAWRKEDPERSKRSNRRGHLKRLGLGITLEDYEAMFERQSGVCAICGKPERYGKRVRGFPTQLSVDHDHRTGKIRELLCSVCNLMVGYSGDSPDVLRDAAVYLERHGRLAGAPPDGCQK